MEVQAIATVRNRRRGLEDDHWGAVLSEITVLPPLVPEALEGIEDFSHLEVIFLFHRVEESSVETGARHPRGNPAWPRVGILAQRGKDRPNRLGATIVELVRREGPVLVVAGLDAIDGTPVLDIKPVMREFLPHGSVRQPAWATELMRDYWRDPAGRTP